MMYYLYINNVLMPVTPGKITTKIKNRNKTVELASGSELNILKAPGLTEVSFELLLPCSEYSFARYENGFKSPDYFLGQFEYLKTNRIPFDLVIIRTISAQTLLAHSAKLRLLPADIAKQYDFNSDGRITAADARILLRNSDSVTILNDTNLRCAIEDYSIIEDAEKYGQDIAVSMQLKQCPEYALKTVTYSLK